MPAVSVVIPAYNAARTLPETLASALAQTHRDLEVVVVDDGSTDDTAAVARDAGDDRVRVVSVANGGVARARNTGIREASGDFVAFLDADDLWRPTKLERQFEVLSARRDVGACFAGAERIDEHDRTVEVIPAREYANYCEALLLYSVVVSGSCSSGMVRRELAVEIDGFDPGFSQTADWDFWLRLSRITTFAPVAEPLVLYRTYEGNMSSDVALLERDTFRVLKKFFDDPASAPYAPLQRRSYCNHWMICSGSYLHAGQVGASLRCLAMGLREYPAGIRQPLGLPARWIRRLTSDARAGG